MTCWIYIPFQNVAASQFLFIFSKSSLLAEKSQSLTRVKKLGPLKPPACNLQNLLADSFLEIMFIRYIARFNTISPIYTGEHSL